MLTRSLCLLLQLLFFTYPSSNLFGPQIHNSGSWGVMRTKCSHLIHPRFSLGWIYRLNKTPAMITPHRRLHPWLQLQPLPRAQASKAPTSKPSPPCVSSSQSAQLHNLQPFSPQRNGAKERGAVLQEGQCLCDTVLISGRQCSYFLYNLACFCHNLECQGMAPFSICSQEET